MQTPDVNHFAALLFNHSAPAFTRHHKVTADIHVQDVLEFVVGIGFGGVAEINTSDVEEDIDAAEFACDAVDTPHDIGAAGNVTDFIRQARGLEIVFLSSADHHLRAPFVKGLRDRSTDTT
jgi:hypothetical protein